MKLCAFWYGGPLSYLEQLCLASAIDVGHTVDLWTYDPVDGVPKGVIQRDAREVMPENLLIKSTVSDNAQWGFAVSADIFRTRLLQQERGCYIDCDVLLLKPIAEEDNIFGWETASSINNAVLRLPPNSPIIAGIHALAASRPVAPPWWRRSKKLNQWGRWVQGRDYRFGDRGIPRSTLGPEALTYFAKRHGLAGNAKPINVFYPVPHPRVTDLFDPSADLTGITDDTVGVHLWNSQIKLARFVAPIEGSFVAAQCKRLKIFDPRWRWDVARVA